MKEDDLVTPEINEVLFHGAHVFGGVFKEGIIVRNSYSGKEFILKNGRWHPHNSSEEMSK